MRKRFRHLTYAACTIVAFLTLGAAPRVPEPRVNDLPAASSKFSPF